MKRTIALLVCLLAFSLTAIGQATTTPPAQPAASVVTKPAAATPAALPSFDFDQVQAIMAGALGLTVIGVTQMIKQFLKVSGFAGYLISYLVSAAATTYYLVTQHIFTIIGLIGYSLLTFLVANGIFKATHTPTTTATPTSTASK
jgi:hypothetical protein